MKKLVFSAALVGAAFATQASAQTFDFEDAGTSTVASYSSTVGGLTLDLSREGKAFSFSDIGGSAPGFNNRSLAPFVDLSSGAFVANFSAGLSSFSVQMGDFGPSDEDTLTLSIFSGLNGTGTLLGSTSFLYSATTGFPTIATLSLSSATAFRSAVFNGGSAAFPNSVYYDNISVTVANAVPEPATWALMILGFGAVGGAMRRRQSIAARVRFA